LNHKNLLAVSAITVLFAAACGGGAPAASPAPSSPAPAASAAAKASAPASASAKPAASAGASAAAKPSTAAAAGGSVKVGYIIPLTGVQADIAKYNQDGFNMYLESVGSTMAGRKIEVSYSDDQLKPDVGLTKAKELVENSKVNLLMGMSSTSVAYPVAQYAKTAEVPLIISTNAGSQGMTMDPKFASPYLVRITQNGAGTNDVLADWL